MLTVEALKAFGANTDEGLTRCMNNEEFYLKMVRMAAGDQNYAVLQEALEQQDLDRAFEAAHGLKGVLGNLSLTPLFNPVSELTELLRSRADADYTSYAQEIAKQLELFRALAAD